MVAQGLWTQQLHVEELVGKAYDKAFSQYAYNYFMMKFTQQDFIDDQPKEYRHYLQKWADDQPVAKWYSCLMTVNAKVDDMATLKKAVEKFANRTIFKSYMYCYEQRSTSIEQGFHGFHAHILLFRDNNDELNMSHLKRYAKNSFKHVCEIDNTACLNFKTTDIKGTPNFIKYVSGTKVDNADKHKLEKCSVDIAFRAHYHLDALYVKEYIPPSPEITGDEESAEADSDNDVADIVITENHSFL